MSSFPEYPERSPKTVWVGGIGLAPKERKQLLPPVIQPVEKTFKAGPIDVDIHAALTSRRNLAEGGSKQTMMEFELGGYAVAIEISVERLPKSPDESNT